MSANDVLGPWVAVPSTERTVSGAHRPIFKDGLWHIIRENNPELLPIATVDRADDHDDATREEAKQVALLIAAAPDLREALRDLCDAIPEATLDADPPLRAWMNAGRAAIAKAENR